MVTHDQTITISECPLCHRSHTYSLRVQRSTVEGFRPEAEHTRRFRRLFHCPKKDDDYYATIELRESGASTIDGVEAVDLVTGSGDG